MEKLFVMLLAFSFSFVFTNLGSAKAFSQISDSQKRTEEILAIFTKTKHKVKDRSGIRVEKYKEMRSEPVLKSDIRGYSGEYEVSGLGYTINIQIGADGVIRADGYEPPEEGLRGGRKFTLKDARIDSALLTATKVYADGGSERFEGGFINLTDVEGTSPTQIEHRSSSLGLGVTGVRIIRDGLTLEKLFYQLKQ